MNQHTTDLNVSEIKTLDFSAKEWLDKVNGNSYFSAKICVNFGLDNEQNFFLPRQYGYGETYKDECFKKVCEAYNIETKERYFNFCRNNDIVLRYNKRENCHKRDLNF